MQPKKPKTDLYKIKADLSDKLSALSFVIKACIAFVSTAMVLAALGLAIPVLAPVLPLAALFSAASITVMVVSAFFSVRLEGKQRDIHRKRHMPMLGSVLGSVPLDSGTRVANFEIVTKNKNERYKEGGHTLFTKNTNGTLSKLKDEKGNPLKMTADNAQKALRTVYETASSGSDKHTSEAKKNMTAIKRALHDIFSAPLSPSN